MLSMTNEMDALNRARYRVLHGCTHLNGRGEANPHPFRRRACRVPLVLLIHIRFGFKLSLELLILSPSLRRGRGVRLQQEFDE